MTKRNYEWATWAEVEPVLNLIKNQDKLLEGDIAERIRLSSGVFSAGRRENKMRKVYLTALMYLAEIGRDKDNTFSPHRVISKHEAELIFILCFMAKDKLPAQQKDILALQTKMSKEIAR